MSAKAKGGCVFQGCGLPKFGNDLCKRHHNQQWRGTLGKTREIAAPGEGGQVTFACNRELREAAEKRARQLKLNLSQYLRHLIETDTKA